MSQFEFLSFVTMWDITSQIINKHFISIYSIIIHDTRLGMLQNKLQLLHFTMCKVSYKFPQVLLCSEEQSTEHSRINMVSLTMYRLECTVYSFVECRVYCVDQCTLYNVHQGLIASSSNFPWSCRAIT